MKKVIVVGSFVLAIALGIGISMLTPSQAFAAECVLGYPSASGAVGTCKDGTWTLMGYNCTGRYDLPPYGLCHCESYRCIQILPYEPAPDPIG